MEIFELCYKVGMLHSLCYIFVQSPSLCQCLSFRVYDCLSPYMPLNHALSLCRYGLIVVVILRGVIILPLSHHHLTGSQYRNAVSDRRLVVRHRHPVISLHRLAVKSVIQLGFICKQFSFYRLTD